MIFLSLYILSFAKLYPYKILDLLKILLCCELIYLAMFPLNTLPPKPTILLLEEYIGNIILELNFAKYPNIDSSDGYSEDYDDEGDIDLGIMQLEAGMGIGPSITINPVDQLKACVYFHVTPSYSLMVQNNNAYHHYATFFNLGLTVSYKIISLGIESRWSGKTSYDGLAMDRTDDVYDDDGVFHDPFESIGMKMKTNTFRIFIGLRW